MYTGKPLPPLPSIIQEAGWAAGFIHVCRQSALGFGSDRKMPVATRPVVELRIDGNRRVVLPCTSQNKSPDAEFYELTVPDKVVWTRIFHGRTFVFRRYEAVLAEVLIEKIGVMPHPARITLLDWLKARY